MFSAYAIADTSSEDSEEERIMFTVEDTFKDVFTVEDTEKERLEESKDLVPPKETVASSESAASESLEESPSIEKELPPLEPAIEETEDLLTEATEIEGVIEEESVDAEIVVLEEPEVLKPQVDVIIVIDNSGSMKFILRGIGKKMQTFKNTLNLFDFRIAFLSARVNPNQDKRLMDLEYRGQIFTQQNFLEPEMDNQILIDTLVRGKGDKCDKPPYCGGLSERTLGALEAYLLSAYTEEFIREESEGLAVVLITDNEENRRSKDKPATTSEDVINVFNQNYSDKNFKAYTLTILDEECQKEIRRKQFLFREGHFAPTVTELAEKTNGENFSLCLDSYKEVAEQIVEDFSFTE